MVQPFFSAARAALLGAILFTVPAAAGGAAEPAGGEAGDPLFSRSGIPSRFAIPPASRAAVPTPLEALGHRIGDRYTSPEEIVRYARIVAAASPRARVETYGTTPEGRELVLVTISSETNLSRRESLRKNAASLADPSTPEAAVSSLAAATPPVVWISCSVHGDEPAGSEAGLALLWWLAASREEAVTRLLDEVVVVLDPDANPDGKARHVSWWRSVAGDEPDPSPAALENDPPWPDGRTNHAGFDLNRDWAWTTQQETRSRVAAYLSVLPQVFVDLHEMGPESTYFFPPAAEPVHARLPEQTRRWLETFGRANARAFDERGWSYFVREVFDFFYPAYGDSWPAFHGAIGMTYETAGSAGLSRRRRDGTVLTLKERALKHFTAARTTLETAAASRADLMTSFAAFFREPFKDSKGRGPIFAVPAGQDPTRLRLLAELLSRQGVRVERSTAAVPSPAPGASSLPAGSLLVDSQQPFGRYAEALLESNAVLPEAFVKEERSRLLRDERDRFFEVTAWGLPVAWGLDSLAIPDRSRLAAVREPWPAAALAPVPPAEGSGPGWGWVFPSDDWASRKAAGRLLVSGVRVQGTSVDVRVKEKAFPAGSFLVRREHNPPDVAERVASAAAAAGASPVRVDGAWTDAGPSFGSTSVTPLRAPRVVLLTGDGTDPSSAASLSECLERDLGVRVSRRRVDTLVDGLGGVTALLLPNASDGFRRELLLEPNAAALRRFVEGGGIVIAVRSGAKALREKPLSLSEVKAWESPKPDPKADAKADPKSEPKDPPAERRTAPPRPPSDEDEDLVRDLERRPLNLPGAALKAKALPGHPLLYGLAKTPAFLVADGHPPRRLPEARANVVSVVTGDPLAAGFGWREALDRWAGAPLVLVEEVGRGRVVTFAADPAFRATWLGSEALLLNAVLFLPPAE